MLSVITVTVVVFSLKLRQWGCTIAGIRKGTRATIPLKLQGPGICDGPTLITRDGIQAGSQPLALQIISDPRAAELLSGSLQAWAFCPPLAGMLDSLHWSCQRKKSEDGQKPGTGIFHSLWGYSGRFPRAHGLIYLHAINYWILKRWIPYFSVSYALSFVLVSSRTWGLSPKDDLEMDELGLGCGRYGTPG